MPWFSFIDSYSGGICKLPQPLEEVLIEAHTLKEAVARMEATYNVDVYNVTCECCGQDFSIFDPDSLESQLDVIAEIYGPGYIEQGVKILKKED